MRTREEDNTASSVLASAEGTEFTEEDYGIFARMAASYFKPRETIRKSAHLRALSLSLPPFGPVVLSHSHSAADDRCQYF